METISYILTVLLTSAFSVGGVKVWEKYYGYKEKKLEQTSSTEEKLWIRIGALERGEELLRGDLKDYQQQYNTLYIQYAETKAELNQVKKEVIELREENTMLKGKLGLMEIKVEERLPANA